MSKEKEVTSGAFTELEFATLYEAFHACPISKLYCFGDEDAWINSTETISALSDKMEKIMAKINDQISKGIQA